jgi:hypothetical protein
MGQSKNFTASSRMRFVHVLLRRLGPRSYLLYSSNFAHSELPAKLLSAPFIWVRCGGVVAPLQLLYDGPFAVLRCGSRSFTI